MNIATKIGLFLLFISLHLNIYGLFVESQALFYVSFFVVLVLTILKTYSTNTFTLKTNGGHRLVFILFLIFLTHIFLEGNRYGISQTYMILACLASFFVFGFLFAADRRWIKWIGGVIVLSVIFEILLGFGQLFGWIDNNNEYFNLGGSFGNPGAYAGYLAVVSPLILSVLLNYRRTKKAENLYYILLACFVFMLFLLVLSQSRGAWLATALGGLMALNHRYLFLNKAVNRLKTPLQRIIAVVSVVVILSSGAFLLYQFKANSAFGRVLVWKVAASANPLGSSTFCEYKFGFGPGYFEANYGKWQADYFAKNHGSEAERYVADYVTCAYNDFLETYLELGQFGIILLIWILWVAFKQKTKSVWAVGAKASLGAMVVLMMVSYPLKVTPVYIYFIFCLSVLFVEAKGETIGKLIVAKITKLCLLLVGVLITLAGLGNSYGSYGLRKGQKYVYANQIEQGIKAYEKVSTCLKNDGIFHFYYGSALHLNKQYETSVGELEKSIQTSSNPSSYILLGNNYKELQQPEKAAEAYLLAANMTPSRLYPKYLLAKLYMDLADDEQAEKWAREILNTKEKVPTTAAKEIKQEMEEFINSRK